MSPILSARGGMSAGAYGWGVLSGGAVASFESIQTVTGNGSGTTLSFTSIPNTFQHLQIRGIAHNDSAGVQVNGLRFNSDSGSTNYSSHYFASNGSSTFAGGNGNQSIIDVDVIGGNVATFPYALIIDILDYASTSKYKTAQIFAGYNKNTASGSVVELNSGAWKSTSVINSITLSSNGNAYSTSSTFCLYGIKGA